MLRIIIISLFNPYKAKTWKISSIYHETEGEETPVPEYNSGKMTIPRTWKGKPQNQLIDVGMMIEQAQGAWYQRV